MPTASLAGKSNSTPKLHNCSRCGLSSSCKSPKIPHSGNGKKRILIIGPSVCKAEDDSNNERHGSSYAYLKRNLKEVGIDLEEDCWYTHAIRCYSKKEPGLITQSACYRLLMREIDELDPISIVVADPQAWDVLLYDRLVGRAATAKYQDWCGEVIPDQVLLRWIIPIYSASFVDEQNDKRYNPYILFWHKQMQNILTVSAKPRTIALNLSPCKTRLEALIALDIAMEWRAFAFDYETTGIKSFDQGHQIAYMSISNGVISYSFAIQPDNEFQNKIRRLLTNNAVKIAHNANFEREWTSNILGYEVTNLVHDTMLMQHVLHNRKPTGLKFLAYAQYGYLGYDADADEYLKSSSEDERVRGANAHNRVFDAPVSKLLEYNAMDSLFTYWLYEDLYLMMDRNHQIPGYDLFMELSIALYHAHMNGIRMDTSLMERTGEEIEKAIRPYVDQIMTDPLIVQKWSSSHQFNPRSDHDIRTLLYTILKLEPTEFTDSGQPAVDADTLYLYVNKVPIIQPLFQIKRLNKLSGTYIRQMKAEQNDGTMHAYFHLNRVVTYRSGSSNVNLQNQPKRDKESRKIIRSIYLPRKGHKLIEYDFKAMEVSVAAAVTGDSNLIKYVTDPSTDMHRDLARRLFFVEEVDKNLRGIATKGPWVFAEFYGSYWKQTAAGVWAEIDIPNAKEVYGFDVVKHLRKCGITSYEKWEKHCEEQEYILWNEFFPGYKRWRDDTFALFQEQGYVDYVDGFRYYGPATRNEVLNGPVQGPAFHVQGWAFKEMDKFLIDGQYSTRLVGQIHDSIVADVDPAEEDWVDRKIHELATVKVREHWDWITVPLVMEKDSGEIDGSWAEMKSCGVLRGEL